MILFLVFLCGFVAVMELWVARQSKLSEKAAKEQAAALRSSLGELRAGLRELRGDLDGVSTRFDLFRTELDQTNTTMRRLDQRLHGLQGKAKDVSIRIARVEQSVRPILSYTARQLSAEEERTTEETAKNVAIPGTAYGADESTMPKMLAAFRSVLEALDIDVRLSTPPEPGSWYVRFYLTTGPDQDFGALRERVARALSAISDRSAHDAATRALRDLSHLLFRENTAAVNAGPLVMMKGEARLACQAVGLRQLHELNIPELIRRPEVALETLAVAEPLAQIDLTPWAADLISPADPPAKPTRDPKVRPWNDGPASPF